MRKIRRIPKESPRSSLALKTDRCFFFVEYVSPECKFRRQ